MQLNLERLIAAEKQLSAVTVAFDAGMATVDRLLDAQRRLGDAEMEYTASAFDTLPGNSFDSGESFLAVAHARALLLHSIRTKARDLALQTWRKQHALLRCGPRG